MKKGISIVLMALLTFATTAQTPQVTTSLKEPVTSLDLSGNCTVAVEDASDNYRVQMDYGASQLPDAMPFSINGSQLTISDTTGSTYHIYTPAGKITEWSLKEEGSNHVALSINGKKMNDDVAMVDGVHVISDLPADSIGDVVNDIVKEAIKYAKNQTAVTKALHDYTAAVDSADSWQSLRSAIKVYTKALDSMDYSWDDLLSAINDDNLVDITGNNANVKIDTLVNDTLGINPITVIKAIENLPLKKRHYSYSDRTEFDFHWGWNNWGSSMLSGLTGMSEPGYDLRTSFSSYQLSYNYNLVMTEHFDMGLGIGYESDVYKFNDDYVDYQNHAFTAIDTTANVWSTRFVTRYIQVPVHIAWRSNAKNNGFKIKLSAIPALGYCGSHTGLKHELEQKGKNYQDQTNLKDDLNPFKLDMRVDIEFKGFGVFFQMATMPVFKGCETDLYPFKFGFVI